MCREPRVSGSQDTLSPDGMDSRAIGLGHAGNINGVRAITAAMRAEATPLFGWAARREPGGEGGASRQ